MEGTCEPKREVRCSEIIGRLTLLQEDRQKLINSIGECVNKLQSIVEPTKDPANQPKRIGGFLSEVENHLDSLRDDNVRLDIIYQTLRQII